MSTGLASLPRPVAWVCTSGAARAAAQVGMLETLHAAGLVPDLLVGSSTGAVNAAAMATLSPDFEALRATWRRIGAESTLGSLGAAAVRGFAPRRTGKSAAVLRSILAQALPGGPDSEIPPRLAVVASDLVTGDDVVLRDGSLLDALTAATTFPVVFQPVAAGDALLIDGGLTASAPLDPALAMGAASVVLLDTGASATTPDAVAGYRWWQLAALAYGHQIRGQMVTALARAATRVPVATISTGVGSQFDFGDPDRLFAAGAAAAEQALADMADVALGAAPGVYGPPAGLADHPRLLPLLRLGEP